MGWDTPEELTDSPPDATIDWTRPGRVGVHARSHHWAGFLAIAAVGAYQLAELLRIAIGRPQVVLYGDQALLALGARKAGQFHELLGPYSRMGFHHPGPALLYLLAPFVGLFHTSGTGLYAGAATLNLAVLVAAVGFVWRRCGPLAALWTAMSIDLFAICLAPTTFREPWNPYLVVAPMVLFILLWATAVSSRSAVHAVWALVVGSCIAQTEISTAPTVALLSLVMLIRVARGHGPNSARGGRAWVPAGWGGLAGLVAVWLPPVLEVFVDHPDNPQKIWDFFTGPHAQPGWRPALRVAGDALTVLPFGNHDYALALHRSGIEVASEAVVILTVAALTVWVGRRRGESLSVCLIAGAVLSSVIGALSLGRSAGPVYLYFALWLSVVPAVILVGLGISLLSPADQYNCGFPYNFRFGDPLRVAAVLTVLAVASSVLTLSLELAAPTADHTIGSGPWPSADSASLEGRTRTVTVTSLFDHAALAVLRPGDRSAMFTIGSSDLWPYAAGVVLSLDEHRLPTHVAPSSWNLYFGDDDQRGATRTVEFALYLAGDRTGVSHFGGTTIASADGAVLEYRRGG